ncbi:hypothetical protein Drorol1_Dr00002743 [Drosera rotundifolia]
MFDSKHLEIAGPNTNGINISLSNYINIHDSNIGTGWIRVRDQHFLRKNHNQLCTEPNNHRPAPLQWSTQVSWSFVRGPGDQRDLSWFRWNIRDRVAFTLDCSDLQFDRINLAGAGLQAVCNNAKGRMDSPCTPSIGC